MNIYIPFTKYNIYIGIYKTYRMNPKESIDTFIALAGSLVDYELPSNPSMFENKDATSNPLSTSFSKLPLK